MAHQKFAMGAQTLSTLQKQTGGRSDDLGTVVRELAQAAAPLESRMNGAGRAAFDQFAAHVDEIATELDSALASVLAGIAGQNVAFTEGVSAQADATRAAQSSVNFDAARFH